jgi:hypothetical protein
MKTLLALLLLIGMKLKAQENLVRNSGFDEHVGVTEGLGVFYLHNNETPWYCPHWFALPADPLLNSLFNVIFLNPKHPGAPNYSTGLLSNTVRPRSDSSAFFGYFGGSTMQGSNENHYHYICSILKQPLKKDHIYYVEYFALSIYEGAISNIDLLFTHNEPGYQRFEDGIWYYPANPQIKNPIDRFISDTINWTRICGFYKAEGGELYITIGNFFDPENTPNKNINEAFANYLIDDITITEIQFPADTSVCYTALPIHLNAAASYDQYYSYLHTPGNNFAIADTGVFHYTIGNEACSLSTNIHINGEDIPQFTIPDTSLCENQLPLRYSLPIPSSVHQWNSNSSSEHFDAPSSGKYWLTITNSCASVSDTFTIVQKNKPELEVDYSSVLLCQDDTLLKPTQVTAQFSNADFFVWNNGDLNPSITLTEKGIYTATATNECGSTSKAVEASGCPPDMRYEFYVPNLITANGDGHNDFWEIKHKNIQFKSIEIYNSFGALVFKSDQPENFPENMHDPGVYFYLIDYLKPHNSETLSQKGWLQLIR